MCGRVLKLLILNSRVQVLCDLILYSIVNEVLKLNTLSVLLLMIDK